MQGQDFGQITSVPNHCNFFLYRQTLFAISLVYIFNKFCICSFMLNTVWVSMVYFQNWFLSQVYLQFNQEISYPLSDMIVGTYDCRVWYMYSLNISAFVVEIIKQ